MILDLKPREWESRERTYEQAHAQRVDTVARMACALAHELSQPLEAIRAFAQACLLRLPAGSAGHSEALAAVRAIITQAERATEVVQGVRRFMKNGQPLRTIVDVGEVVAEVVSFTGADARDRGIRVRLERADVLPPVRADRVHVQQVLVNLVRNALDATRSAGSRRDVVVRASGSRGEAIIEVHDRGRRPEHGDYERLFRSFHTTKRTGLGLGLTISRALAELHGGALTGEPRPGGGSTFRLTIPVWTRA